MTDTRTSDWKKLLGGGNHVEFDKLHGLIRGLVNGKAKQAELEIRNLVTALPPAALTQQAVALLPTFLLEVIGEILVAVNGENAVPLLGTTMVLLARFRPLLGNPRVVDDMVEVLNDQAIATKYIRTSRSLGKGQYAEVFLGYDCTDGKKVAIKRIDWRKQVELNGPRIEEVLRREIQTMQNISHRNIVRLYDTLNVNNHVYLMLEYCAGGTLADTIRAGALSEAHAREVLSELAEAFKYLQKNKTLHRDLKPENVLFGDADKKNVKLADFTFARITEPGRMLNSFVGSPLYMAPEIFNNKVYSDKADLWSIGVILYEMLTRTRPFEATSFPQLIDKLKRSEMVLPPGVSPACADCLRRLLQKNPDLRISWGEFFMHEFVARPTGASTVASMTGSVLMTRTNSLELDLQQRLHAAEARATRLEAENKELQKALAVATEDRSRRDTEVAVQSAVVQELCQKLQVRCELLEAQLAESERRVVLLEAEKNKLSSAAVATASEKKTDSLDEEKKRRALVEDLQNAYESKLKALEEVSKAQQHTIAQAEAEYKKREAEFQTSLMASQSRANKLASDVQDLTAANQQLLGAIRSRQTELEALQSEKAIACQDYQLKLQAATEKVESLEYILRMQQQEQERAAAPPLASVDARNLQTELNRAKSMLDSTLDKNRTLAEQKDLLERQLRDTTRQLDDAKAHIDTLTRQMDAKKNELQALQSKLNENEELLRHILEQKK